MRKIYYFLVVSSLLLILLPDAFAQAGQSGRGGGVQAASTTPDMRPFDPRDLSGYWFRNGGQRAIRGTMESEVPPMTPEGEALLRANIPARGGNLGDPLNGRHWAYV